MVLTKVGKKRVYPYAEFDEQIEKNKVIANTPEAAPMYGGLYGQTVQRAVYPYEKQTQPQQTSGYAALAEVPVAEVPAPTAKKPLSYAYTTPQTEDQYAEWYKKNGTQKMSQSEYDTMQGVTRNYAEYARRMGVPEVQAQAESDYSRALSGYGVKAEKMAQAGIHGGYSDYLDSAAYAEMQRAKANAEQTARKGYAEQIAGADAGYAQYAYGVDQQNKADYKAYKAGEEAKTISEDQYRQYLIASGMTEDEANAAVERARSVAGKLDYAGYASYLNASESIEQIKRETEKAEKASAEQQKANDDSVVAYLYDRLTGGTTTDKDGNEVQGWTLQTLSDRDYKAMKEQLTTELGNRGYTKAQVSDAFDRVDRLRAQNEKTFNDYKTQAHDTIQKFASGNATADDVISALGITMPTEPKKYEYVDIKTGEFLDGDAEDEYNEKMKEYETATAVSFIEGLNEAVENGAISKEDRSAAICAALPLNDSKHTAQDVYDSVRSAYTYYENGWITKSDIQKVYESTLRDYFDFAIKEVLREENIDANLKVTDGKIQMKITLKDGTSIAIGLYDILDKRTFVNWTRIGTYSDAAQFAAEKVKNLDAIAYNNSTPLPHYNNGTPQSNTPKVLSANNVKR